MRGACHRGTCPGAGSPKSPDGGGGSPNPAQSRVRTGQQLEARGEEGVGTSAVGPTATGGRTPVDPGAASCATARRVISASGVRLRQPLADAQAEVDVVVRTQAPSMPPTASHGAPQHQARPGAGDVADVRRAPGLLSGSGEPPAASTTPRAGHDRRGTAAALTAPTWRSAPAARRTTPVPTGRASLFNSSSTSPRASIAARFICRA
jgi:hypothetical protein